MIGKIRVLMVVPNLRVSNGVATFAMNYLRTLKHDRCVVDFITYRNIESPFIDEIKTLGGEVFTLPFINQHPIEYVKMCAKIIRTGQYDIIHDNSLMITFPIMLIAKGRVPIRILHSHSAMLGETKRNEKRNKLFIPLLVKTANVYFACSSKAAKALFGDRRYCLIPNTIQAEKFRFDQSERDVIRQRELTRGNFVVGTVGRLTDAKNPLFALDVMDYVLSVRQDIEYWWIGSGALDKEVEIYKDSLRNKDRIKLFGSRTDVDKLYQALDLFFLPSKHEGFGLACIEAQCAGLSCVVADTLPKEVNITGRVTFIPLLDNEKVWGDTIISEIEKTYDRKEAYGIIKNSIYTADENNNHLLKEYNKLINQYGQRECKGC